MTCELKIVAGADSGVPTADVPCDCMWDLMEYLSYQRVAVHYDFHATHFSVAFPRLSAASAQELLDHWAHGWVEQESAVSQ